MTKTKSSKRALLISALALLLCVSMLIGSTFAWFTDSVTSTGNIIKSGTLDVTMEWADGKEAPDSATWADASKGAIFEYSKWEPGFAQVRHIKIANKGTLALKYQIKIVANGQVSELAKVIDVYYADPAVQVANRSDLASATVLGTLDEMLDDINNDTSAAGELPAGKDHTVTIALKMQESAGNEYQAKSIGTDFSIQLVATQATAESDSFDDQYDVDAEYPLVASGKKALNEVLTLPYDETNVQIVIPAEAYAGNYAKVVNSEKLTEENGKYTYAADFAAVLNGEKVDPAFEYQVNLKLPQFVAIEKITHNGNEIPLTECEYDAFTGVVTFYTNSFSPFEVTYTEVAENPTSEGRKITGGIFTVNPVTFDDSLGEVDSEYICVPYVKNGVSYYAVSKRTTTVIVAANDEGKAAFLDGKDEAYYSDVLNASGSSKLWSIISGLQNNDFSTVYILPGTYNEGTTINVYSSMNIMGIGDTDSVKIVKTSSSSSNRHLFNVSGTKADYINVTLENLYLDATAKTTNSKDNGAVQSIRKSKVKCYDLTIVKGSGLDAVAFYVNGNNAVDGVKYPAYLYVENCNLNVTRTFGIVTTSGSYKFYHNNLTYGGTAYTNNSASIKNVVMDHTDWDW